MNNKLTTLFDKLKRTDVSAGGIRVGDFVRKKPKKKGQRPSKEKGIVYDVFSSTKKAGGTVIKVRVWMESGKLGSKQEFRTNYVAADRYNLDTHYIDVTDESRLAYNVVSKDGEEKEDDFIEEKEEKQAEEQPDEDEYTDDDDGKWIDEFSLIEQFWEGKISDEDLD